MKRFLVLAVNCLMLFHFGIGAEDACPEVCPFEEQPQEECCAWYRCPDYYENSRIVVPIERPHPGQHPSSHESSFYEQMTR